jgi:hypothetical protein
LPKEHFADNKTAKKILEKQVQIFQARMKNGARP